MVTCRTIAFMALIKIILIFVLTISSAMPNSDSRIFNSAKSKYKNKQYQESIRILKKRYPSINFSKTPSGIILLMGWNYEELKQYNQAQNLYAQVIRSRFQKQNRTLMSAFKKENGNYPDENSISQLLKDLYFYRYRSLVGYFKTEGSKFSEKRKENLEQAISIYKKLLEEYEIHEDEVEEIWEDFMLSKKTINDAIFNNSFYFLSSYVSWKDTIDLINQGQKYEIQTTAQGWCFGGGYKIENATWSFGSDACYGTLRASVGTDANPILYFQKNVPVLMLMASPFTKWKPHSKNSAIGLSMPFLYKSGKYTEPDQYKVDNKSKTTLGLMASLEWTYDKWEFFTKFGKVQSFRSSLWQAGITYNLSL